ncbi:MAG: hypothetical protein HY690_16535 [Chloroflexi bacterium]|nr:hypothetical protein [Chloroflexota bacterium]
MKTTGPRNLLSAPYFLIDTATTNLVGSYCSKEAALEAVADAARRYGRDSDAVTCLALLRDDVPEHEACVASGRVLVALALEGSGQPEQAIHVSRAAAGDVAMRHTARGSKKKRRRL